MNPESKSIVRAPRDFTGFTNTPTSPTTHPRVSGGLSGRVSASAARGAQGQHLEHVEQWSSGAGLADGQNKVPVAERELDVEETASSNVWIQTLRLPSESDTLRDTSHEHSALERPVPDTSPPQIYPLEERQTVNSTSTLLFRKPDNFVRSSGAQSLRAAPLVKQPRSESLDRSSSGIRPKKSKPRHIHHFSEALPGTQGVHRASPPSPLFFSHSSVRRPNLPISFTGTDAATMLKKARDESGGITTLQLARGSIGASTSSPARSSDSIANWSSADRISTPRSPDLAVKQAGLQILGNVGIIELLEQDERPTFIIDVANPANFNPGAPLQIVFANAALRAYESVLEMVSGKTDLDSPGFAVTHDFPEFKNWALSFVKNNESLDICLPSFVYGGVTWICSTLRRRLRILSGSVATVATVTASTTSSTTSDRARVHTFANLVRSPLGLSEPIDYFGDARASSSANASPLEAMPVDQEGTSPPRQSLLPSRSDPFTSSTTNLRNPECFDWTRLPISAALPRHIQFARSIDWASTALGPIESWSFDLRAMCNMIMGSPHPAAMYWGEEYIAIYNEAYILLAGQKHPTLMGQSYKTAWAEIWDEIESVFSNARQLGQATYKEDDRLFLMRNGYLEESYFSWSIIPLIGEDGSIVGLYNPAFEKTRRKIAERRMLTLREVGEKTASAKEIKHFWGQVIEGLEYNEYDCPFVLLYSVAEESDSEMSSMHSGSLSASPQCVLEGSLGVPEGHRTLTSPLDLKTGEDGFAPYLRESTKFEKPILLTTENNTLSFDLIDGMEWRGFGDPCRAVVICPIIPTTRTGEAIIGFLVMGVNPRRPYDDDYSLFIQLLTRQLATSMASAMLFEEEIRRGQRAARLAALDRQELSKQLDLRTQEAVESETKFTRMAEFAPVGMFIANSLGEISYSNDTWWEISRHPRTENSANDWMSSVMDQDRDGVRQAWDTLMKERTALTHEFRFKTPWQDRNGSRGDTWVLMSAYPEKDPEGNLKSVFGSITDISQQKWAEDFQKRRMEEAVEMKRQQENFIDMTSHEMRNPLSAILQCADEISTSLSNYQNGVGKDARSIRDLLDSSIDAAQTISLCAQHQKRIVDDILTLSKLDSALLIVTPVAVQPIAVVQRALKMFEGELDTNDIAMEFRMEKSYLDMSVDWVKLDPSRLLQVLINLTTNAIKFTSSQEKRTIVVSVGASRERPETMDSDVAYFPSRSKQSQRTTEDPEWGTGENVFLKFAVQDTGRGLDESEKALLFQRFRQASPRTHVQYGGSGLGLFISRELTELQGGEIGVASERGIGSTFAFYVKARRADHMPQETPVASSINSLRRTSSNTGAITLESRKNSSGKAVHRSNTTGKPTKRSGIMTVVPTVPSATTLDYSKLKVLIVEDNLVNQRVLQKQLHNIGFITEVANHGGEALEVLKNSKFWKGKERDGKDLAIVLMDLEMPVMDGLTCARTIRDLEAEGTIIRHVPIVAVTANARLEQIESAISAGMDDVVSKPFRIPDLIPKIEELVARNNATTTASVAPSGHANNSSSETSSSTTTS